MYLLAVWMSSLEKASFDLSSVITIFTLVILECQWVFVNDLVQSDVPHVTAAGIAHPRAFFLLLPSCLRPLQDTHDETCWLSLLLKVTRVFTL